MKKLRQLCAVAVLTFLLANVATAGQMSGPTYGPPAAPSDGPPSIIIVEPVPETTPLAGGEGETGLADFALEMMWSVFSLL